MLEEIKLSLDPEVYCTVYTIGCTKITEVYGETLFSLDNSVQNKIFCVRSARFLDF